MNIGKYKMFCVGWGVSDVDNDWVVADKCKINHFIYSEKKEDYQCEKCFNTTIPILRKYKKLLKNDLFESARYMVDHQNYLDTLNSFTKFL